MQIKMNRQLDRVDLSEWCGAQHILPMKPDAPLDAFR
jgi:hypothetical protein